MPHLKLNNKIWVDIFTNSKSFSYNLIQSESYFLYPRVKIINLGILHYTFLIAHKQSTWNYDQQWLNVSGYGRAGIYNWFVRWSLIFRVCSPGFATRTMCCLPIIRLINRLLINQLMQKSLRDWLSPCYLRLHNRHSHT